MNTADPREDPAALVERLRRATNDHDLDGLVACFATDYRNETPAHPQRSFTGCEQVRKNWTQIFAAVPDLGAEVLATAVAGDTCGASGNIAGRGPMVSRS